MTRYEIGPCSTDRIDVMKKGDCKHIISMYVDDGL